MAKRVVLAEAAKALGKTRTRLHQLCQEGRVVGARMVHTEIGPYWTVPVGADGKPKIKEPKRPVGRPRKERGES